MLDRLNKIISIIVAIAFTANSLGYAEPAVNPQSIVHSLQSVNIPESYGRVEKCQASKSPQVILIKDAHCNYEAQRNISKILDILIRDHKIDLIGVEGASGYVNPSVVLESNPKEDLRKKVSDKYLRTGLLTASEALSINKGKEPGFTIFGTEDLRLYLKDFKAFRDTVSVSSYGKRFIELVSGVINQLKGKIYTTGLKGFESIIKRYELNELPLSNLIKILDYNYGIPNGNRNLKLVHKSIRLEEEIDFKLVERERTGLIKELEKTLPKEELQELVKQSLLYRLGKIPAVEYYTYLEPLARTTNLKDYIRLVKLQNRMDENGLFRELDDLIENIYVRLCHNKIALNLHQLDSNISILNKLLSLEAAREDLAYYKENRASFTPEKLLQFIRIQAPLNNIKLPPELNEPSFIENTRRAIIPAEEFYRFALERDEALVKNLLKVMQKNKKGKAVIICGGFHAEGIKRILQDRDISILTIAPSITRIQEDAHELYLNRMLDKRIDPEKMLSELGLETIQPILALSPEGQRIGLPEPLRKALGVVEEAITPDELRGILPLLQELYQQNETLASFIEEVIAAFNASLPEGEERIVLEKPAAQDKKETIKRLIENLRDSLQKGSKTEQALAGNLNTLIKVLRVGVERNEVMKFIDLLNGLLRLKLNYGNRVSPDVIRGLEDIFNIAKAYTEEVFNGTVFIPEIGKDWNDYFEEDLTAKLASRVGTLNVSDQARETGEAIISEIVSIGFYQTVHGARGEPSRKVIVQAVVDVVSKAEFSKIPAQPETAEGVQWTSTKEKNPLPYFDVPGGDVVEELNLVNLPEGTYIQIRTEHDVFTIRMEKNGEITIWSDQNREESIRGNIESVYVLKKGAATPINVLRKLDTVAIPSLPSLEVALHIVKGIKIIETEKFETALIAQQRAEAERIERELSAPIISLLEKGDFNGASSELGKLRLIWETGDTSISDNKLRGLATLIVTVKRAWEELAFTPEELLDFKMGKVRKNKSLSEKIERINRTTESIRPILHVILLKKSEEIEKLSPAVGTGAGEERSTVEIILEQVSDEKFYITELYPSIDTQKLWDRLHGIITNMEATKRNWYWNHLTLEAKIAVTRRLIRLIDVCEELKRKYLDNLQDNSSIICFGSVLWGEGGEASDIDIFVVHSGEIIRLKQHVPISNLETIYRFGRKRWERFPPKNREVDITFRDTAEIEAAGRSLWNSTGRFMFYGSGVVLWGKEYEIFPEPIDLFVSNIEALLKTMEYYLADLSKGQNVMDPNRKLLRRFIESCIIFDEIYSRLAKVYAEDKLRDLLPFLTLTQKVIEAYNEGINDSLANMYLRIGEILGGTNLSPDQVDIAMWQNAHTTATEMHSVAKQFLEAQQRPVEEPPTTEKPPAHIAYLGVPRDSKYYADGMERNGKTTVNDIKKDLEGKTETVKIERKTANIDKRLLVELRQTKKTFLALLSRALAEARRYPGADLAKLRKTITIALLDRSAHLAENHQSDGFIGINRLAIDIYREIQEQLGDDAAFRFIQFLLEHELVHELTGKGEEIEEELIRRDAERFVSLFGEDIEFVLGLLNATDEFKEWVKFYNYKEIATKGYTVTPGEVEELKQKTRYQQLIIKQILQESDIGRYLDNKAIDELADHPEVKLEVYGEGEEVVKEGDAPDSIYLIVIGEVGVSSTVLGDIGTLKKGGLFGEIAVLTSQERTAAVKAKTERVVLLRLSKKTVDVEGLKNALEEFARKRLIDQIERLRPYSVLTPIDKDWQRLPLAGLESLQWRMSRSVHAVQKRKEVPQRLSSWHTKLDKLTEEEAREYDTYMREIGEYLLKAGIAEENVIQYLEQLDNLILAQDIVSEQFAYIPINARHVLNTARNIIAILNTPGFRKRREMLEKQHGEDVLRPLALFTAMSHQVGYRMVEVGKSETYVRYRELGARMISDTFGAVLKMVFGSNVLDNILDALKLQGERKSGMLPNSNPLLFLLTLAQQMDISARRLEEWQKSPFFIQILSRVTVNSEYIDAKLKLENMRRIYGEEHEEFLNTKKELRELIQNLSNQELEKMRSKKIVGDDEYRTIKRALQSVDLEGVDFFLGTAMIEDIKIIFDSEGKLLVKVYVADKAMEYGSFANTEFYVNLVIERMQRSVLNVVEGEIRIELTSRELRQELGGFIERLPLAELHSHLNGAIEFNRQWQMLIERYHTENRIDWDNVKGKDINARLSQLYPDMNIDLNNIFQTAMYARSFLVMVLKDRGEPVSDETSDLELLPFVNEQIKDLEKDHDLYTMLRLYINMRNHFRSLVEYLPIEEGKLPEFVMHFAVGSAIGKAEDRQRELRYLENNAYYLAMSSYKANGYYYEYRINLGKTKDETREEVEAIIKGIERAEEEIGKGLKKGEPGFEGRIVLSFGRIGNKPEEYAQQAREFVAMLKGNPELLEHVVGIDVANQEEGTPPEAFRKAFRIIEAYNSTLAEDKRLQMTYHVGEGFSDVSLETSLRFVDEVIEYGASRLGHAIILGIDPAQFTKKPGQELVSERINTLNWIRKLSEKLNLEYFTVEYIKSELKQLKGKTVSVGYIDNDKARRDIEKIQDYLLTKVIERDIVIETNPTSNVAIVVRDMGKHPLRKFLTFRHLGKRVRFTINTDDAGVFGTDLRREYLRVAEAFGLTVQELWEIASEGFKAYMGRVLRYQSEIDARLGQMVRQPAVAYMESMQIPENMRAEHYSDTLKLTDEQQQALDKAKRNETPGGYTPVTVEGRQFYVQSNILAVIGPDVFRARLAAVLLHEGLKGLPVDKPFLIASLKRSPHLFEDHVGNGFIGINEAFFSLYKEISDNPNLGSSIAYSLLELGLLHELTHEATGKGIDIEETLTEEDARWLTERINNGAKTIALLDILEGKGILEKGGKFSNTAVKFMPVPKELDAKIKRIRRKWLSVITAGRQRLIRAEEIGPSELIKGVKRNIERASRNLDVFTRLEEELSETDNPLLILRGLVPLDQKLVETAEDINRADPDISLDPNIVYLAETDSPIWELFEMSPKDTNGFFEVVLVNGKPVHIIVIKKKLKGRRLVKTLIHEAWHANGKIRDNPRVPVLLKNALDEGINERLTVRTQAKYDRLKGEETQDNAFQSAITREGMIVYHPQSDAAEAFVSAIGVDALRNFYITGDTNILERALGERRSNFIMNLAERLKDSPIVNEEILSNLIFGILADIDFNNDKLEAVIRIIGYIEDIVHRQEIFESLGLKPILKFLDWYFVKNYEEVLDRELTSGWSIKDLETHLVKSYRKYKKRLSAAHIAAGTKSHKAGTPKVGGREAQNEDADFVVDSWFRQDRVYCGYKSKNTPDEHTTNSYTDMTVEFSSEAHAHIGEAFKIIGKWRNKWEILKAIRRARKSGLLHRQLARLDDKLYDLEEQREQMVQKGLPTEKIDSRIILLGEHMRLLDEFIKSPRKVLNERLGSVYVMILRGLDFLIYNDPQNYWAGHSSTSRNAIYIPAVIYGKLIGSPNALAAFLVDELIDGIVGEHTELSNELIRLFDKRGELTNILRLEAETNNRLINRCARTVTDLINEDRVLDAVKELEGIFGANILPPSCLPSLLRIVLTEIEKRKIDTKKISMFAFTLSGSQPIRDILHDLIRETAYPPDIGSSDFRLNGIVDLIRHPQIASEVDEWDRFIDNIKKGLEQGRVEEMANLFKDYLLNEIREIERIKRFLALFFAKFTPEMYRDPRFKGFIYKILYELRDVFSPIEYIESAIHIISKVEGLHISQTIEALKMLAEIEGYTGRELLLEREYQPIFTQLGINSEIAKEFFRSRRQTIFSTEQIELAGVTTEDLEKAGYKNETEFKEEIAGCINKEGLLEKSLGVPITPSVLAQAKVRVTRIHCSGHTLVCLGTVDINGSISHFVLKKTFGLYDLSIKSDVVNFYKKLVEEAGELAEKVLVRPLGEWITTLNQDRGLMGYIRTEEYLPGLNLAQIEDRFGTDSEECRIAKELSASLYYILFRNIAKGRWFIYDATGGNVMLIPTGDGGITGKVVDIEARLDLPEGIEDRYFLTFLENRGILIGDIEDIRGPVNSFIRTGRFDLRRYDSAVVANLVNALKEWGTHMTEEPTSVKTRPDGVTEGVEEPTGRLQIDLREVPRLVAIGDVHGDLDALKEILLEARLIDEDGHWTGGNATLVQLGDIVDRGPDSIGTLNYLLKLQDEAEKSKGKVVLLLGNHELAYLMGNMVTGMRLSNIVQRIKKKEKRGEAITKADYDELDMAKAEYSVIKGLIEEAVSKERLQAMHVSGNTVFVHARIKPLIYERLRKECRIPQAETGIRKIAEFCNKKLRSKDYRHYIFSWGTYPKGVDIDGSAKDAGILWARLDDKADELPGIRQVVGHTVKMGIARYGGIFGIDVGIAQAYGGRRAFLEITPKGEIRGSQRGPGADETWAGMPFTWTGVRPPVQPPTYSGIVPFEELGISEELVYEDGTNVRGVLSAEDVREIKDSIQRDGRPVETGLGVTVKLKDSELNNLLLKNLADLLQKLPPKERDEFLTALKANAPPEGLVIAILDHSEHLGENCQSDGFIGVNRYLLLKLREAVKCEDQTTVDALSNLLQVILYHELRHEARLFEGPDEEFRQNLVDIRLLEGRWMDILINLRLINPESKFKKITDTVNEIANRLGKHGIEMDHNQKEELKKSLLEAYEGMSQINLLQLINMLAKRITPEKIFQLTAEIAEPINRFLEHKDADKGGRMIAAVLKEILELIPEERRVGAEIDEEKLLRTIQSLAAEKGIDPNAMQSVFDLFKKGLEILALDPSYRLDSNYFELISQIEKITGIDDKKIIEVFSRRGLLREKAETVADSPLAQEVQKLALYIELNNISIRGDLDLEFDNRRGLFYLDGFRAKVDRKNNGDIRFLSGVDAINKDLAKAYKEIQDSPGGGIIDRQEKITLVISADTFMSIERDGKFLRFSYKPGIQALLRILANAKNIHIVIRADKQEKRLLEETGLLNEQISVEDTEKELKDIRTDAELSEWAKDENHVVFLLTPEEGESVETKGLKAFGIAADTAFHAALLFGVTYAQAQTMEEIETAINSLKLLGMAPGEVDEILRKMKEEGLYFFTVKLIRIEETLKELQNRRLYIEVAA